MRKPIKVFYSVLSGRFYASQHWKQLTPTVVTITGAKFDVTNDIGDAVTKYDIEFTKAKGRKKARPV